MIIEQKKTTKLNYKLVTTKTVFVISIIVIALTVLSVWLFGLGSHRTLYANSMLSVSILSVTFFLFLFIGLFNGIKLKDDLGKITDKIDLNKLPDLSGVDISFDVLDIGDGIEGIILGVFSWILFSLLLLIFLWVFGTVFWAMILVFCAMLYWIFFRALRLVFKNSNKCRNDLKQSLIYSLAYTGLYNFWIFGILLAIHYLNN